ncbi:hypothetical protein E1162_00100 [Rhodobacteraceae bacterium RKSG542]|uniref:hypothetical protein n=1 Tax=Pseudovibrio flavus TaxID=2529854 RepID=UPI0012BCB362|nr:hypothetical protein [Pseudovibrio flavus]MTI15638.1 hypothetical protein [Pseudovibrio flavus]
MNKWLFSAGVLSLLLDLVHVFLGGPEIHNPVLASNFDPVLKAVLSVVWHGITVVLLVNGALLITAAFKRTLALGVAWTVIAQYTGFSLLFIAYGALRLDSLMDMPQWISFLVIVLVACMGLRNHLKT